MYTAAVIFVNEVCGEKKGVWTVIKSNVQFRVNTLDVVVTTISACGSWAQRQVVSHTHNNAKKKVGVRTGK